MKIKFLPQNVEIEGTPEKSILQLALENKLEIRSICKGVPSCAECRVKVVEGADNTLPPSKAELNLIGSSHYLDGRRLSCQVRCFGDVTIDLTEQVEKSETQTKKIRGFRTSKHAETTAVNDTMLLNEKIDDKGAVEAGEERGEKDPRDNESGNNPDQRNQQQKPQQQKQRDSRQAKTEQRNNQGQQKGSNKGANRGQEQQQKQQAKPQQQNQKQNQNRPQQGQSQQNQKQKGPR